MEHELNCQGRWEQRCNTHHLQLQIAGYRNERRISQKN
ncbi:hypothetical protein C5167_042566, partial [Papaver somniferum]